MKKFRMKFNRRTQIFGIALLGVIIVLTGLFAPMVLGGVALAALPIWGSVEAGTFKELSEDELKEMEPEDLAKYFNELNKNREKVLADKIEKMKSDASEELKNEVTALKSEIMEGNKAQIKAMNDALEAQGMALRSLMQKGKTENGKTIKEILDEKKDEFKDIADGKIVKFTIDRDQVLKTDVTRSSVSGSTMAMRLTDIGQLATQRNVMRSLFRQASVGPNSNGVVRYVDQYEVTRSAAWTAESGEKPESAISWIEKTMKVEKIPDTIPVTMEALEDVDFIEGEIRNFLLKNLELKVDANLLSGTGVSPKIKGIYTYADTYVPVAAGITKAQIYDLLVKVHEDISEDTGYTPNIALMNISDINKMRLSKDDNGNYILPPFAGRDGSQVAGMTVIASNSVTANTMVVGDFDYATLYTLGKLDIKIGLIEKQFIENQVTLLAEERMGLLVRSSHTDAFRKVTSISAALTTIAS